MTKAEWAYSEIKAMILEGRFRAGTRLLTATLAQSLDVSDTPVREALRMLERDGYVTIRRHQGATVAQVAWQRAYEIVGVRMYLEILAIREASACHTPTTLDAVAELLAGMQACADANEPSRFSALNREFHTALYAPGPNATLKEEIQALWDRLWVTRSNSFFQYRSARMGAAQIEHAELLDALRAGDAETAAAVAAAHRTRTLATWRDIIATEGERATPGAGDAATAGGGDAATAGAGDAATAGAHDGATADAHDRALDSGASPG